MHAKAKASGKRQTRQERRNLVVKTVNEFLRREFDASDMVVLVLDQDEYDALMRRSPVLPSDTIAPGVGLLTLSFPGAPGRYLAIPHDSSGQYPEHIPNGWRSLQVPAGMCGNTFTLEAGARPGACQGDCGIGNCRTVNYVASCGHLSGLKTMCSCQR